MEMRKIRKKKPKKNPKEQTNKKGLGRQHFKDAVIIFWLSSMEPGISASQVWCKAFYAVLKTGTTTCNTLTEVVNSSFFLFMNHSAFQKLHGNFKLFNYLDEKASMNWRNELSNLSINFSYSTFPSFQVSGCFRKPDFLKCSAHK